jgi:hypothetical protein
MIPGRSRAAHAFMTWRDAKSRNRYESILTTPPRVCTTFHGSAAPRRQQRRCRESANSWRNPGTACGGLAISSGSLVEECEPDRRRSGAARSAHARLVLGCCYSTPSIEKTKEKISASSSMVFDSGFPAP